ncbi:MAG: septum formation initiator family protein [Anaerolineales bacterium]|nr:septum formation initiator family protein [Anaerolineales bacterium]MCW5856123.1 septum formation initiator family protein [Anaerolineales bacterium]
MEKIVKFVQRFPLVVGAMLLVFVLLAFTQRVSEYLRLSEQLENQQARLTELAATQTSLEDQIAYATSQAAVEEWAREDARWSRDGDFVVIPIAPADATPEAVVQFQATPAVSSPWDAWMNWLFYPGP